MTEQKISEVINKFLLYSDFEVEHLVEENYYEFDMHFHDFYECTLFISGNVSFQVEDYTVDLAPNSLLMLKPNQVHRPLIRDIDVPYERYILRISPKMLDSISTPEANLAGCFQTHIFEPKRLLFSEKQELAAQYEKAIARMGTGGFGAGLLLKTTLVETLILICQQFLKPSSEANQLSIVRSQLTADVIQYIGQHIQESISLAELASEIHLSKHYLSRVFKQETSISIYKFILQKRIIYARELLLQGISPSNVYFMCGFSDYSNFYRAFRNEYGISPREYQHSFSDAVT